jgi:RNA polymerase sigma-70 factor (ECF subfamily)
MNVTMMGQSEAELLQRWAHAGDADAFSEITRLYAGMVYGTCLRITGNQEHAADAAQETFYDLLKHARRVTGSLGGWLHQVAVRRAIDLVRRDAARRRHESAFATAAEAVETDQWADVSPLVDEAIGGLEADLRDVLLRHYLQGQSTVQIAAAKGVSQSTISRRIEQALASLRGHLRAKGVLVSATALAGLMPNATTSAPAVVWEGLGKMALTTSGAAAGGVATMVFSGLTLTVAGLGLLALLAVGGFLIWEHKRTLASDALPAPAEEPVRIGVYDSRSVTAAYTGSARHEAEIQRLNEALQNAKASGDTARIQQADDAVWAARERLHRQGFGTYPVDDILGLIPDEIGRVKRELHLTALVSQWDEPTLAKFTKAEKADVTEKLVDALKPSERQRRIAIEIQKLEPIPPDRLEELLQQEKQLQVREIQTDTGKPLAESSWGEAVEGVQVRLHTQQTNWNVGATPRLFVDVRNQGTRHLLVQRQLHGCEVEVDGLWFRRPANTRETRALPSPFPPGREYDNLVIDLNSAWQEAGEAATRLGRIRRVKDQFTPGKHAVRLAVTATADKSEPGKPVRAISNPVEIEIMSARDGEGQPK